ncbi:MAG: ATP-dependent helicase [Candidatus Gracilibacteria bacterium]|nr:ATP-dependent helicase [Candidatus Gracilibacteria bacterium]
MNEINFEAEYNKLNPAQKQAVDSIYGQVMVVAGPGTGKTQIIGLRTANIIEKTGVNPENILITTFTDAGVIAIRKRLVKFLGNTGYKVTVSTIHSFASDVIKTFPEKFIEYKAGNLIDDVDSLEIIKKITDKLVDEKKVTSLVTDYDRYFYLRDIKSRISNLKQEAINTVLLNKAIEKQEAIYAEELSEIKPTLKKYETTREKNEKHILKLRELVLFYAEYNSYLRENSVYDFNDMINFVLEKFESDRELRQFYAETFQFIMLDEYQDTNNAQNKIIDLILSEAIDANIMTVGDDDQSIYRFQGANIENMLDFSTKYKETQFVVLEENYRSTQHILDLASSLIENNNERLSNKITSINKKLTASSPLKTSTIKPLLFKANSQVEEQTYIINNIKKLVNSGISKEEIAIIVRNNREVEEWSNLLQKNHLDVESKLKTNILNSNYVIYILNYLELIANPNANEEKLINLMRNDITGLNSIDILKINRELYIKNYTRKFNLSMFDFLSDLNLDSELGTIERPLELRDLKGLIDFRDNLLDFSSKLSSLSFTEFFADFSSKIGIIEYIEKNGDFADLEDIYTLFNTIKNWNTKDIGLNIKKLLNKVELYKTYNYPISRQILTEKKGGIQILTAHSSKGLEYNSVFIPGLYTGNWDSKATRDLLKLPSNIVGEGLQEDIKDKQQEEDRRLFFVALTRARENLFLSYPAGIGTKPLLESQFIGEISGYFDEVQENIELEKIEESVGNNIKNHLIKYSNLEIEYIKNFLETYKLSPSDLNTFLENPLDFLHKAVFKYPFMDNKYTIFGKVYHRTLELFYLKFKNEQLLPEKSYLTSTFKYLIEREILTPEELENALEKGINGLEGYYDLYSKKSEVPLVLEYSFRKKNLFFENVPLTGTVDKIEKIGEISPHPSTLSNPHPNPLPKVEGTGNSLQQLAFFKDKVALVDYKTGKAKSIGEIKGTDRYGNKKEGEGKYFRQLMFYKLLCEVDFEFSSKFEVGSLALDFVEGKDGVYKYVEVDYTSEDYEEFKNELREAWNKITDIGFWREILEKE